MNKKEQPMEQKLNNLQEEPISNEELSINKSADFISTAISFIKQPSSAPSDTLWFNLIFIEINFSIESLLFKEEFLWDRKRRSSNEIKQFAIELIRETVIDEKKCDLKQGINTFTSELLDLTAERITKEILNDIYFYEHFHPFYLIQSGLFESSCGFNQYEHLISISLDIKIKETYYQEEIKWNILDCTFSPEDFALHTVNEMSLPEEFIKSISYEIRKQIKNYVFNLFEFVAKKHQVMNDPNSITNNKLNKKGERKHQIKVGNNNNEKGLYCSYLFDNKLSLLLGHKTERSVNDDELFPLIKVNSISINEEETIQESKLGIAIMTGQKKQKNACNKKKTNSNIIHYDCNTITINKSIFGKEEYKRINSAETIELDLMSQNKDRESNSNRSHSETKSTSPKTQQLILKGILSDKVKFTKWLN